MNLKPIVQMISWVPGGSSVLNLRLRVGQGDEDFVDGVGIGGCRYFKAWEIVADWGRENIERSKQCGKSAAWQFHSWFGKKTMYGVL